MFAQNYRALEPYAFISHKQNKLVDSIIEDLSNGKSVRAFDQIVPFKFEIDKSLTKDDGIMCSELFLEFIEFIADQMNEQKISKISHIRLTELLFNIDVDDMDRGQDLMLWEKVLGRYILCSTKSFTARLGAEIQLTIVPNDAYDVTLY